jgi:tetratricopeptide (TPR) repeat protein
MPRSSPSQRMLRISGAPEDRRSLPHDALILEVPTASHDSFAALRAAINQLRPLAPPSEEAHFRTLDDFLSDVCVDVGSPGEIRADGYGRFLSDAVAFAILRRISRESVYTARVIDLGARLLNRVLTSLRRYTSVHVFHLETLDRPSLKVFARAMLLLEPSDRFSWYWHSSIDPLRPSVEGDGFTVSRLNLLRHIVHVCKPTVAQQHASSTMLMPSACETRRTLEDVSAALVVQNYDACFLWAQDLLRSNDDELAAESLRLLALAAVNTGQFEQALALLNEAEVRTRRFTRRAHYCYLQGLIEAKRRYDSQLSEEHYRRGLAWINGKEREAYSEDDDVPLEHAWLLNGLALNEVIGWRHGSHEKRKEPKTFRLLQEAFSLVRTGDSPARFYLRFNLLANAAFLLEIQGKYTLAAEVLTRAFDQEPEGSQSVRKSFRSAMAYRLGTLSYRSGDHPKALRLLKEATNIETDDGSGATLEHVLRARGIVAMALRDFDEAEMSFSTGLNICLRGRFAEGAREHGRGLVVTLCEDDRLTEAEHIVQQLIDEGIPICTLPRASAKEAQLQLSSPAPKLPAYIPEIDLEDVPAVNLNRFLSGAAAVDAAGTPTWARS